MRVNGTLQPQSHNSKRKPSVAWNASLFKYGLQPYLQKNGIILQKHGFIYKKKLSPKQVQSVILPQYSVKVIPADPETGTLETRTYPRNAILKWSHYSLKLSLEFKVWRRYIHKK